MTEWAAPEQNCLLSVKQKCPISLPGPCLCSDPKKDSSRTPSAFEWCGSAGGCFPLASSSESTLGCLFDKCRRRLLMPPLTCSLFVQMRQRAESKLSNCSKSLQINLRLRVCLIGRLSLASVCVICSAGPSCEAVRRPLIAGLNWASFTMVMVSGSPSSRATSTE